MASQLKMAAVYTIYTLLERGWSRRRIARELGIDRGTVRRYAQLVAAAGVPPGEIDHSKPPGAPPGSDPGATGTYDAEAGSNPAGAPPGAAESEAAPPAQTSQSECEPFREIIQGKLDQGLSAKRIWQDLVRDHAFPAKYHSVRRFVRKLGKRSTLPFRRMECEPGVEAQVDFGKGAPVIVASGGRKRPKSLGCEGNTRTPPVEPEGGRSGTKVVTDAELPVQTSCGDEPGLRWATRPENAAQVCSPARYVTCWLDGPAVISRRPLASGKTRLGCLPDTYASAGNDATPQVSFGEDRYACRPRYQTPALGSPGCEEPVIIAASDSPLGHHTTFREPQRGRVPEATTPGCGRPGTEFSRSDTGLAAEVARR